MPVVKSIKINLKDCFLINNLKTKRSSKNIMNKLLSVLFFLNIIEAKVNIDEYQNVSFEITAEIFSDSTAFKRLAYLCDSSFNPILKLISTSL